MIDCNFDRLSLAPQVLSIIKEVDPILSKKIALKLAMLIINARKADRKEYPPEKLKEDANEIADELDEFVKDQTHENHKTDREQRTESPGD